MRRSCCPTDVKSWHNWIRYIPCSLQCPPGKSILSVQVIQPINSPELRIERRKLTSYSSVLTNGLLGSFCEKNYWRNAFMDSVLKRLLENYEQSLTLSSAVTLFVTIRWRTCHWNKNNIVRHGPPLQIMVLFNANFKMYPFN